MDCIPDCRDMSRLLSEVAGRGGSRSLRAHLHLWICDVCRRVRAQFDVLGEPSGARPTAGPLYRPVRRSGCAGRSTLKNGQDRHNLALVVDRIKKPPAVDLEAVFLLFINELGIRRAGLFFQAHDALVELPTKWKGNGLKPRRGATLQDDSKGAQSLLKGRKAHDGELPAK